MAIAAGHDPEHPASEADEEFLRQAGQIWSRQTPSEADVRWHRVDPDVELYEEDEDTGGGTGGGPGAPSSPPRLQPPDPGYFPATPPAGRPPGGKGPRKGPQPLPL